MSTPLLRITNDRGRHFNVRIVRVGEHYGRDDCLEHGTTKFDDGASSAPLVEFYDATYADTERFADFQGRGQFVSRYGADILLGLDPMFSKGKEFEKGRGLDLQGDEPVWKIDGEAMDLVRDWIHNQTEGEI